MIYILPGMGADHRMFPGPWRRLPQSVFVRWPRDGKDGSISSIASRVAEDAGVADGAVLVGSSLGGIVACEIAKIRRIERLVLVGSARSKEEISGILRLLHPLIDLAPLSFVQRACGKIPQDLCAMFRDAEPAFIRSMCRAIFRWEGFSAGTAPLHRIHGRHDLVIPPPGEGEALIDGGHLIAMSHPEVCVRFVEEATSQSPNAGALTRPSAGDFNR